MKKLLTIAAVLFGTTASAVEFERPEASPIITAAIDSCFEPVMSQLSPGTILYWTQDLSGCYTVSDKPIQDINAADLIPEEEECEEEEAL